MNTKWKTSTKKKRQNNT